MRIAIGRPERRLEHWNTRRLEEVENGATPLANAIADQHASHPNAIDTVRAVTHHVERECFVHFRRPTLGAIGEWCRRHERRELVAPASEAMPKHRETSALPIVQPESTAIAQRSPSWFSHL